MGLRRSEEASCLSACGGWQADWLTRSCFRLIPSVLADSRKKRDHNGPSFLPPLQSKTRSLLLVALIWQIARSIIGFSSELSCCRSLFSWKMCHLKWISGYIPYLSVLEKVFNVTNRLERIIFFFDNFFPVHFVFWPCSWKILEEFFFGIF